MLIKILPSGLLSVVKNDSPSVSVISSVIDLVCTFIILSPFDIVLLVSVSVTISYPSGAGGMFGVNGVASGGSTGTFIASNCVYTLAYISLPISC